MLKSLQLAGFKSFAEKTRLEFPAGVTVIVGPNGSGKSNIVDAVRWVLGSQSPRSLRGKEMTDVIFNGSATRGPMPNAEVTLAFDNEPSNPSGRRLFDVDDAEVWLTRRVRRSGEGEYLVNGRTCRLKDFRELLAGTGIGAESYSIIEQGRVDAALNASVVERRLLFEEAAGVSRFRLKRREAARRLDRVEQNLLRLSDIVDEVEGRLRRVRAQAGKAQRYREASRQLREARIALATSDLQQFLEETNKLEAEQTTLAERLATLEVEIAAGEDRLVGLHLEQTADQDAGKALRDGQQRLARTERVAAIARVEAHRIEERLHETANELLAAKRAIAASEPTEESQRALQSAEEAARNYSQASAEARQELEEAERSLRLVAQHREQVATRMQRLGDLTQRTGVIVEAAERRVRTAASEAERFAAEARETAESKPAALQALATATKERDRAADALLRIDQTTAQTQREATIARRKLAEAQRRAADVRENLVGLRHRQEMILREQRRLETLASDFDRLVDNAQEAQASTPEAYGLVADLIHVEEDFVELVEAALGRHAEYVVVDFQASLLSALLAASDDTLTTRTGFLTLDQAPVTAVEQVDLSNEEGVIGRAADFVEVEPRFAPLARRLFSRSWFVDDLAAADRLSRSVGKGLTFITLAGEVVAADGTISAGKSDGALHLLTRRRDFAEVGEQIVAAEETLRVASETIATQEEALAQHEQALSTVQREAIAERERLADAAQRAAAFEERRRHFESMTSRQIALAQAAKAEQQKASQRVTIYTERCKRLQAELSQGEEAFSQDAQRKAESDVAAGRARLDEINAAARRHADLLASLRREAREAGVVDRDLLQEVENAAEDFAAACHEMAIAEATQLRARSATNEASLLVEEATRRDAAARVAREAADRMRVDLSAALAQSRAEADELRRRLSEMQMRRQRAVVERTAITQRIRDDYGVDLAEQKPSKNDAAIDRNALRDEIESLQREVRSAGAVNLDSLEELDELETRFAELSGQYEDLSQAKKSLARLTARINADSRELFRTTFETVRGHFRELFTRLFGGGEADLLLVDADGSGEVADPLEAGVEVVACPPGKELRSLSLLSGGEKTMTCVALLLALFRSRPCPFCLLDEVDAALDEANVGRFMEVLKDFLSSTQFIVVTHSKRTMAGADTLYGVTMQESGVSKQVSVRFEQVDEQGRIRLERHSGEHIRRAA